MPILFPPIFIRMKAAVLNLRRMITYDDGKLSICVDHNRKKGKLIPVLLNSMFGRQSHNKGHPVLYMQGRLWSTWISRWRFMWMERAVSVRNDYTELRCIKKAVRMIV